MAYRSLYKHDALTDRERKNIILLDVIRRNGPIAKTDISRITQFNIVTISNYVEHYIEQQIVIEKGLDISSGGRRPELVELNSDWGRIIGAEIGPTHIIAVVANLNPVILHKIKVPRPAGHMDVVIGEAVKLIRQVSKDSKVPMETVKGIGLGGKKTKSEVRITGRIIDMSTGEIMISGKGAGESSKGGGFDFSKGGTGIGTNSDEWRQSGLGDAQEACTADLIKQLVAKMDRLQ